MGLVQHDCKTNGGGGGGYGRGGCGGGGYGRGGCGGGVVVVVQRKDKRGASGFIIVVFNGNGVVWEGSQMNGWRFGDGTVEKEEKEKKKDHVMGGNNSGSGSVVVCSSFLPGFSCSFSRFLIFHLNL